MGSAPTSPLHPSGASLLDLLLDEQKYDLYCKITGAQRIDLLGARVEQLPAIWEELVAAGFESGHAYGNALRTVKSCIGSTWCRYGVQDSTAFAIRVEERYRGLRAPHKLKSAVSGCIRECAEAQGKDFGIIARALPGDQQGEPESPARCTRRPSRCARARDSPTRATTCPPSPSGSTTGRSFLKLPPEGLLETRQTDARGEG